MKNIMSIKSLSKYIIMLVMTFTVIVCTAMSAYAAEGTPQIIEKDNVAVTVMADTTGWTSIKLWIENISSQLKTIGYAIAGLAVIALAIVFITGGGQALQKGKGMTIGILVGVATLSFGVALIGSLQQ